MQKIEANNQKVEDERNKKFKRENGKAEKQIKHRKEYKK